MKPINELGISPAPWKVEHYHEKTTGKLYSNVNTASGVYVADGTNDEDKCLIAVAPELYNCLREAIVEMCARCHFCSGAPGYRCYSDSWCYIMRWRKILDKAAGESEGEDGE